MQDLKVFPLSSQTLDLSRRAITELPRDLSGYKDLENLYLEGNQLTSLPDSLINCTNLKWLDLRNNRIKALPSSIEKLRSLRTLLLEGNQLVSLPPQLSRLTHLTGLNISHNPLQDPPREVIDKGTKYVLSYLRDRLSDEELSSSDSSSSLPDSGDGSGTYIPLKPIATDTNKPVVKHRESLPTPNMKSATLYTQGSSVRAISAKAPHKTDRTDRRRRRVKKTASTGQVSEMTIKEKTGINKSLETMKSKQNLEEWRKQAKLKQKQMEEVMIHQDQQSYPKAVDTAPFATEPTQHPPSVPTHVTPKEVADMNFQRVNRYRTRLEENRRQIGIISKPSTQLEEAEKALAEAMAMQDKLENSKIRREYRLSAFTGGDF